jgi:hypothetical protein
MDYHLYWLYVALVLSTKEGVGPFESPGFPGADPVDPPLNVNANQEDIDLLLVFRTEAGIELVLVEAKAATGWTVKQVASKARRLRRIFGNDGSAFDQVSPHFVLVSPKRSKALDQKIAAYRGVPIWMRPNGKLPWAPVHMPTDRIVISRCDEGGTPAQSGVWWTASGF